MATASPWPEPRWNSCRVEPRTSRVPHVLLGERVLVNVGAGVGQLTLEEMQRVEHVLLSHSHFDHIAALPLLRDAVGVRGSRPLQVHALDRLQI